MTDQRMQVQVKVLPWFSEIFAPGQQTSVLLEEELPAESSLRSLLARLAVRHIRFDETIYDPQRDALRETVVITHNGRLVSPAASLGLVLQSGDTVALIPAYSGG
ncbi:MAG: MoaD/ThiS family protein [Anaerolineae bacterium]|jgi:molybdopterin converting factor small subunit